MAFINERIPAADVAKYGIEEIDKHYVIGGTSARDWTVDRARDFHLRHVGSGREESLGYQVWTLCGDDTLLGGTDNDPVVARHAGQCIVAAQPRHLIGAGAAGAHVGSVRLRTGTGTGTGAVDAVEDVVCCWSSA